MRDHGVWREGQHGGHRLPYLSGRPACALVVEILRIDQTRIDARACVGEAIAMIGVKGTHIDRNGMHLPQELRQGVNNEMAGIRIFFQ